MAVTSRELADFLASYAGMDGGRPESSIWICGIEYGGGFEDLGSGLAPITAHGSWDAGFKQMHPDFVYWPYHQKVAKLMVALRALRHGARDEPATDGWREYLSRDLYAPDGETFKLNLYPLASPSVTARGWAEAYGSIPALRDKPTYHETCRSLRFPFIREIRHRFAPRLILGTGRTYVHRFVEAFGFEGRTPESVTLEAAGARRACTVYRDQTGTLVVSPFLGGRFGINSDALAIELAKVLARELDRFSATD